MGKITYIKIAGKSYPMSFSLGASKKLMQQFGGAQKMKEKIEKERDDAKKIEIVTEILSLLIAQGCAYKNYFEKDIPAPEDAPVFNGKWEPINKDLLEIAIDVEDIQGVMQKIEECVKRSSKKEVELKLGKNAEATQG